MPAEPSPSPPAVRTPPTPLEEAAVLLAWLRRSGGRWLAADAPGADAGSLAAPSRPGPAAGSHGARPAARTAPGNTGKQGSPGPDVGGVAAARAASAPAIPLPERVAALARMADDVASCKRCRLCETRTRTVFGVGSPTARLVVVGEAPGADEDRQGEPFVGRAGQLLDRMLGAIGLSRDGDDVYICNVLKCRPPGNRDPHLDEVGACRAFLDEQLRLLKPEVVLALGAPAARTVLGTHRGISSLRGRFLTSPAGWRVMPTWHPAYLLRQPDAKREAWADLQKVAAALGLSIPPRA
ncbi:MAG: uracil-DNA glycosylase [Planctomycetes bacterium]|nr:uracil-DNA glycosylase [Planctomycetota bacterium]MCB9825686.1 uracil-DNA glycosylase [Planctomycetota bacterium]MCB9901324.1 uracil-DNA glycosylase [Planctomycetota bacterium]